MFRAVLLTLAVAGACAAQPPTPRERFLLVGVPKFDPEAERLRWIGRYDRIIQII